MATSTTNIEQLAINTIRTLSMDGVQAANSGHPGTPMALAPVVYAKKCGINATGSVPSTASRLPEVGSSPAPDPLKGAPLMSH